MRRISLDVDSSEIDSEHFRNHEHDCHRLKRILREHGWDASLQECYQLWDKRSNAVEAGWLFFPDSDEEVFEEVEYYL